MSILGWLGALAFKDVRFLNRNAVMKVELERQFERMRKENLAMHKERMKLTGDNHEENKARFDRLEDKIETNEDRHQDLRRDASDQTHDLVTRIEEVNADSIARDATKEDRK